MAKWYALPDVFPVDGATVWCRRFAWMASPFKATWAAAAGEFTTVVGAWVLPWYFVTRWRAL